LLYSTGFAKIASSDCKSKIVAIKEGRPFQLKKSFAQFSGIMGMN
jgi:hypothetical protein